MLQTINSGFSGDYPIRVVKDIVNSKFINAKSCAYLHGPFLLGKNGGFLLTTRNVCTSVRYCRYKQVLGSVGSSRSAQSQKSNQFLFHWWQFATQVPLENMIFFFLCASRKTLSPASDFKS